MGGFLFVGEKPSRTAHERGWTWESGRLAAKQLFDALEACSIRPQDCGFVNLFGDEPWAPPVPRTDRVAVLRAAERAGARLVAMGGRVAGYLDREGIAYRKIRHPAARGAGRLKSLYAAHVREALHGERRAA
jgi:hypothetical protein